MLLTERMNRGNAVVVSQATIAQILNYTRSTVNIAVKLLESERWGAGRQDWSNERLCSEFKGGVA